MKRLLLNLTLSLDGFIADEQGGVDWLRGFSPELAADFEAFLTGVDTLVMGRASYEITMALPGGSESFANRRVIVFTSHGDLPPWPGVEFVQADVVEFTRQLKEREGGGIWLFGGGLLATALSDAGLVDDYILTIQPILLGKGIPLWRIPHACTRLRLAGARTWPDGLVELRYTREEGD